MNVGCSEPSRTDFRAGSSGRAATQRLLSCISQLWFSLGAAPVRLFVFLSLSQLVSGAPAAVAVQLPSHAHAGLSSLREADVIAYEVSLDVDEALQSAVVETVLDVAWRTAASELRLDLISPALDAEPEAKESKLELESASASTRPEARGLMVERVELQQSITGNGGPADGETMSEWVSAPFVHRDDVLSISLPRAAAAGERLRVRVRSRGTPRDGLVFGENQSGERVVFADHWPDRARHWIASLDHPSDKALFTFDIEAPSSVQAVAVGERVLSEPIPGALGVPSRTRTRWRTRYPLATKVAVVGLAPFSVRVLPRLGSEGIESSSWTYVSDPAAPERLGVASLVLARFVELLGPFPYEKLAHVQSTTRYGGMENAGTIFYAERALRAPSVERLIAHEIAHQWFGNAVTEASWRDVWLSEGFATYLTMLYVERVEGLTTAIEMLQAARRRIADFSGERPAAVVRPASEPSDPNEALNAYSYQKGAWVLHMLRQRIGETEFFEVLGHFFDQHRHGNATTEDFLDAVRWVSERQGMLESANRDVAVEVLSWLEMPGHPRLEGSWEWLPDSSELVLELQQTQAWPPRRVPLEIALDGEHSESDESGRRVLLEVPAQRRSSIRVPLQAEPSEVVLDPRTVLLFEQGDWRRREAGAIALDEPR